VSVARRTLGCMTRDLAAYRVLLHGTDADRLASVRTATDLEGLAALSAAPGKSAGGPDPATAVTQVTRPVAQPCTRSAALRQHRTGPRVAEAGRTRCRTTSASACQGAARHSCLPTGGLSAMRSGSRTRSRTNSIVHRALAMKLPGPRRMFAVAREPQSPRDPAPTRRDGAQPARSLPMVAAADQCSMGMRRRGRGALAGRPAGATVRGDTYAAPAPWGAPGRHAPGGAATGVRARAARRSRRP